MKYRLAGLLLALVSLADHASAQVLSYNAGVAGDPPIAPPPGSQDWDFVETAGGAGLIALSPDPGTGLNALQIGGQGGTSSFWSNINLDNVGTYELIATMKVAAATHNGAIRMVLDQDDGFFQDVYFLDFQIVGGELIVSTEVHPGGWACGNTPQSYTCPGALDGQYHTFALRKPEFGVPVVHEVVYDGVVIGTSASNCAGGTGGFPDQVYFSVRGGLGGRIRINRLEIRAIEPIGLANCMQTVPNSAGLFAEITAIGHEYALGNNLTLVARFMPSNQFGYFLASKSAGFVQTPGGSQGNLCLGGSIGRFASQVQSTGFNGRFEIQVDTQAIPTTPVAAIQSGETWNFQAWFRDVLPAGTPTSNFTHAVRIEFE